MRNNSFSLRGGRRTAEGGPPLPAPILLGCVSVFCPRSPSHLSPSPRPQRNLNFVSNWNKETLRSSVESMVWISTISASYEHTRRLDFACVTGSISAMLVVFIGEQLTPSYRSLEASVRHHFGQENAKDSRR